MKAPFLIGRLLFAGFFINSGISHLQNRKSMAAYARAKGVPEWLVIVKHSLRNAMIPLLTGLPAAASAVISMAIPDATIKPVLISPSRAGAI